MNMHMIICIGNSRDHKHRKKIPDQTFEKKYKDMFLIKMESYNKTNLYNVKYKSLQLKKLNLIRAYQNDETLRLYGKYLRMAHYHAAEKYIGGEATGGSDWRKYIFTKISKKNILFRNCGVKKI